jgi:hypothetical protein
MNWQMLRISGKELNRLTLHFKINCLLPTPSGNTNKPESASININISFKIKDYIQLSTIRGNIDLLRTIIDALKAIVLGNSI